MMKFEYTNLLLYAGILASIYVVTVSCSSSTDPYKPYVGDKEIVYPQQVDTIIGFSGKNRAILKMPKVTDPLVTEAAVFWNSGDDSIAAQFPEERDTLQIEIDSLQREGTYTFDVYTYNKAGNRSRGKNKSLRVYGEDYINSLLPKPVQETVPGVDTTLVYWGQAVEDEIGTELEYTDRTGATHEVVVPAEEEVTKLPGLEWDGDFRYRTIFSSITAIDTFYTDYETIEVIEPGQDFASNKSITASSTCSCGPQESIVDGNYDTYWQPLSSDREDENIWTNIDLETRHKLNKIHIYWDEAHEIASYQLLVSDDEENWELVFEKTSDITTEEKVDFPEVIGRYVQLNVTFNPGILVRTYAVELYYSN